MTGFPFTEGGLAAALQALGDTANAVADTLLAAGHYGKPDDECACPVAEYLLSVYPGLLVSVIDIPPGDLVAEVYEAAGECRSVIVTVPAPVTAFVRRFDGGEFPELDRTSGVAS